MRRINLKGKKIGKLTIINFSHHYRNAAHRLIIYWNVICDCGVKKKVSSQSLNNGMAKSCGCYRKESAIMKRKKPDEIVYFNKKYNGYVGNAKSKKIEFKLTKEEFREITEKNCTYCGELPTSPSTKKRGCGNYVGNGIDRINSSDGYIKSNCTPCCSKCNYMKNNLLLDSFLDHVIKIYEFSCQTRRIGKRNAA